MGEWRGIAGFSPCQPPLRVSWENYKPIFAFVCNFWNPTRCVRIEKLAEFLRVERGVSVAVLWPTISSCRGNPSETAGVQTVCGNSRSESLVVFNLHSDGRGTRDIWESMFKFQLLSLLLPLLQSLINHFKFNICLCDNSSMANSICSYTQVLASPDLL